MSANPDHLNEALQTLLTRTQDAEHAAYVMRQERDAGRAQAFTEAAEAIRAFWSQPRNAKGYRATQDPHWAEAICRNLAKKEMERTKEGGRG